MTPTRIFFFRLCEDNIVMISQIFRNKLIVPEFEPFCEHIKHIFDDCTPNRGGKVKRRCKKPKSP